MREAKIARYTKIATCCYCGTRAALVLRGKTRHELACSACGAPLHDLKMLPKPDEAPRPRAARRHGREDRRQSAFETSPKQPGRPVKRKRRKALFKKVFEEAFDILDDIFD